MSPTKGYLLNNARAFLQSGQKPQSAPAQAAAPHARPSLLGGADNLLTGLRRKRGNGLASTALGMRA